MCVKCSEVFRINNEHDFQEDKPKISPDFETTVCFLTESFLLLYFLTYLEKIIKSRANSMMSEVCVLVSSVMGKIKSIICLFYFSLFNFRG